MPGLVPLVYTAAPLIFVLMGLGVIVGVVKPHKVLWIVLFLLLLPYLASSFTGCLGHASTHASVHFTWKEWLIAGVVGLVALRLILDAIFRRH